MVPTIDLNLILTVAGLISGVVTSYLAMRKYIFERNIKRDIFLDVLKTYSIFVRDVINYRDKILNSGTLQIIGILLVLFYTTISIGIANIYMKDVYNKLDEMIKKDQKSIVQLPILSAEYGAKFLDLLNNLNILLIIIIFFITILLSMIEESSIQRKYLFYKILYSLNIFIFGITLINGAIYWFVLGSIFKTDMSSVANIAKLLSVNLTAYKPEYEKKLSIFLANKDTFKIIIFLNFIIWIANNYFLKESKISVINAIKQEKLEKFREKLPYVVISPKNSAIIEGVLWDFLDSDKITIKSIGFISIPWNEISWIEVIDSPHAQKEIKNKIED